MRIFILTILLFAVCNVFAGNEHIGRYLTAENAPSVAQKNLMQQTLQVHFPTSVKSVGDAINYLLANSGYDIVSGDKRSPELNQLMAKPLPVVDRELKYMSLKQALLTLVEPAFYLEVDPLHRLISFGVKPPYQKYYTHNKGVTA